MSYVARKLRAQVDALLADQQTAPRTRRGGKTAQMSAAVLGIDPGFPPGVRVVGTPHDDRRVARAKIKRLRRRHKRAQHAERLAIEIEIAHLQAELAL